MLTVRTACRAALVHTIAPPSRKSARKLSRSAPRHLGHALRDWYSKILVGEHRVLARRQLAETDAGRRIEQLEATVAAQAREIGELRRELRKQPKMIIGSMVEAVAGVLPSWCEQQRYLRHRGVWSEASEYRPGDFVTCSGGGWVATAPAAKGVRPAGGGIWTLAIKSDLAAVRREVRDEIARTKGPVAK